MYLFKLDKGTSLASIREKPFQKEKDLQAICERNLELIFDLQFVSSEFALHNFRVDTLAFDREARAFVIIEYKRNERFSVIDQGYAYLSLMLNNKADFILEYNEALRQNLKRDDVDWSQSKVIFVSPSFTNYQRESINFKDLPIELWEVRRYEDNTLSFTQLTPSGASESIKTISKRSPDIEKVSSEVKVYTEDDMLNHADDDTRDLYQKLKEGILSLGSDMVVNPRKKYIAFAAGKRNVTDIHALKRQLKLWINLRAGELDDPLGLARDVSTVGHWGNGDYELTVSDDSNIEYIVSLVRQSYKKNSTA